MRSARPRVPGKLGRDYEQHPTVSGSISGRSLSGARVQQVGPLGRRSPKRPCRGGVDGGACEEPGCPHGGHGARTKRAFDLGERRLHGSAHSFGRSRSRGFRLTPREAGGPIRVSPRFGALREVPCGRRCTVDRSRVLGCPRRRERAQSFHHGRLTRSQRGCRGRSPLRQWRSPSVECSPLRQASSRQGACSR